MMRAFPWFASLLLSSRFCLEDLKRLFWGLLLGAGCERTGRSRRCAFLQLQLLETRDCPATLTWIGASGGNWNVGTNWTGGVAPLSTDDVVFDSTYSNGDCVFTGNSQEPVAKSITLMNDYSGTLHLNTSNPIDIGSGGLTLQNGDIEQDQGENIYDTGNFNWTGGNLNVNSPFVADLDVEGGKSANISGATDVSTGSNIKAIGMSTIVINKSNGTTANIIVFSKNAGISIDNTSTLNWTDGNLVNDTGSTGVITNAGKLFKTPGVVNASTDLAIVNTGTFQLQSGILTIFGKDTNGYAFDQSAGTCELYNKSHLAVPGGNGFHMGGGNLWVDGTDGVGIDSNKVLIDGGVISLSHDNANATGLLVISGGSLTLQGTAEYDAKVDCTTPGKADNISANGITIGGKATLKAIAINIPAGGVPAHKTWIILQAGAGNNIAGDFATKTLTYPGGAFTAGVSPLNKSNYDIWS